MNSYTHSQDNMRAKLRRVVSNKAKLKRKWNKETWNKITLIKEYEMGYVRICKIFLQESNRVKYNVRKFEN